jgi:hypothetical protein
MKKSSGLLLNTKMMMKISEIKMEKLFRKIKMSFELFYFQKFFKIPGLEIFQEFLFFYVKRDLMALKDSQKASRRF